ncbi:MAG: hypothetical protein KTR33_01930 [Gammaproteobacteria bacterium]|nr:hypothetical protein [Gammaproteobacteria bacterium]
MALPLLPLVKIIALGSLKLFFLLFGAIFFPIYALRLIMTGASGMLLPVLDWLEAEERLDSARHRAIVDDLSTLAEVTVTRAEARRLLFSLLAKTLSNMGQAIQGVPATLRGWLSHLTQRS